MEQGPGEIRLTFLATIDPLNAHLSVTGPDGESATSGEPDFNGSSVTVPVRTVLAGDYDIAYEVLSTDGHLVEGGIGFTVTVGAEPSPTPPPTTPAAPTQPAAEVDPGPAAAGVDGAGGGAPGWLVWSLVALGLAAAVGGLLLARRSRRAPPAAS